MRFSSEDLDRAAGIVARWVPPTPQYVWPLLAEYAGAEVWVKHENHTPTGAFKVRGGLVYAERLRAGRPEVKGIVSATRGNHGQSLAFAGRAAGVSVTIVVPEGNSPDKNAAMQGFGAELIVHGRDYQSSREHASELGARPDADDLKSRQTPKGTAMTTVPSVALPVSAAPEGPQPIRVPDPGHKR